MSTTALGSASVCSAAPPTLFLTFPEALGDLRCAPTVPSSWPRAWARAGCWWRVEAPAASTECALSGASRCASKASPRRCRSTPRPMRSKPSRPCPASALRQRRALARGPFGRDSSGFAWSPDSADYAASCSSSYASHAKGLGALATPLFRYWVVTFDGACSGDQVAWLECPEPIGNEPLLSADATGALLPPLAPRAAAGPRRGRRRGDPGQRQQPPLRLRRPERPNAGVGLDEAQRGAGARLGGAGLRAQPERRRRRAPPLRAAHQGAASSRCRLCSAPPGSRAASSSASSGPSSPSPPTPAWPTSSTSSTSTCPQARRGLTTRRSRGLRSGARARPQPAASEAITRQFLSLALCVVQKTDRQIGRSALLLLLLLILRNSYRG